MSQELKVSATVDAQQAIEGLKKLKNESKSLSEQLKNGEVSSQKFNNSLSSLTKGLRSYISAYAAIQGGKKVFSSIKELETGFINIAKTTNMSGKEFEDFKQGVDELGKSLHGVTITEIQKIAETAGQLGVSGKENILSFTETISKIAVATDLTAEQAAEGFAIIENIMGEPISETERLGSVMNELSNTTVATASQIVGFSKRLAGGAKSLGMTSTEVMAFSATLADIGATVEGGGTAMSRLFGLMASDTKAFADASHKTLEEYKNDITNNPVKAVQDLINELSKLDRFEIFPALDDLKISSEETVAVILKMATAQAKLNQNMVTAKQAYKDNTSLNEEYEKFTKGLESATKDLIKAWQSFIIVLSEDLLPALKNAINGMIEIIDASGEFYKSNTVLVKTIGELIGLVGGLALFGKAMKVVMGAEVVAGLLSAGTALASLSTAWKALLLVVTSHPIVLGVAAIIAPVILALNEMEEAEKTYKKTTDNFVSLSKDFQKAIENTVSAMPTGSEYTTDNEDAFNKRIASNKKTIESLQDEIDSITKIKEELENSSMYGVFASTEQTKQIETYNEQIASAKQQLNGLMEIQDAYSKRTPSSNYNDQLALYKKTVDETTNSISMSQRSHERYAESIAKDIAVNERKIEANNKVTNSETASTAEKDKAKKSTENLTNANSKLASMLKTVEQLNATGAKSTEKLTEKQQEAVDKIKKKAEERLETEKNATVEIANKETDLYEDLKKLEDELAKTREKYANKRVEESEKASEKIYKSSQKGKDDYTKFSEDTLRYDQKVAQARKALADGNVDLFKTYYEEAMALADNWAGDEVKSTKEVYDYKDDRASKLASANQKRSDAESANKKGEYAKAAKLIEEASLLEQKSGEKVKEKVEEVKVTREEAHRLYSQRITELLALQLKAVDEEERKEVDAHNEKISMKKLELEAVKTQLSTQKEILKVLIQMIEASTGVKYEADFSDYEEAIKKLDETKDKLENSKKEYKIKANTSDARKELLDLIHYGEEGKKQLATPTTININSQDAENKIKGIGKLTLNGKTITVEADTTPADFGIKKLTSKVEGDTVTIDTTAEWKKAEAQLNAFRAKQNGEEITQDVIIEDAQTKKVLNELEKPTESTHKINVDKKEAETQITKVSQNTESLHVINVQASEVYAAIAQISRDTASTHTIYVRTVETNSTGGLVGRFATGGFIRRQGQIAGHDTSGSDDVKALLTRGEFVQNVRAVDYYGRDFMEKINSLQIPRTQLPKLATGGIVQSFKNDIPKLPRFAMGGSVESQTKSSGKSVNVNLNVGGQTFQMVSEENVADALAKYLQRGEF